MKTGIVTFHHAKYSYGATLQAFAMCKIVGRYSDSVELVNYENTYEQKAVKSKQASKKELLRRQINYMARLVLFGGWKNPYRNNKNHDRIYGCVSPKKYTNASQMKELTYDALICGSDQVWNPDITGGIDEAFWLHFGYAKKRISYAASMGSYMPTKEEARIFHEYLADFSAVSVREAHAEEQLKAFYAGGIKIVIDPTLLLSHEEWATEFPALQRPSDNDGKYILTFFVGSGYTSYWPEMEQYIAHLGLPVWNVQSHLRKGTDIERVICAPTVEEFLRLLQGAALVITNSFHGTAFSINFRKDFIPILNKSNPARVLNLLAAVGLSERIGINPEKSIGHIDYDRVDLELQKLRGDSTAWLEKAMIGD